MPLGLLRHPQETVRGKWGRHLKCFWFLNRLSKQSSLGATVIYNLVYHPETLISCLKDKFYIYCKSCLLMAYLIWLFAV